MSESKVARMTGDVLFNPLEKYIKAVITAVGLFALSTLHKIQCIIFVKNALPNFLVFHPFDHGSNEDEYQAKSI